VTLCALPPVVSDGIDTDIPPMDPAAIAGDISNVVLPPELPSMSRPAESSVKTVNKSVASLDASRLVTPGTVRVAGPTAHSLVSVI
jgi:hypothetical protein